jgi:hypothetical protein
MAVPVRAVGDAPEFGAAAPLFEMSMLPAQSGARDWDLSADGQRFLIGTATYDPRTTSVTIILNWASGMKAANSR